MLHCRSKEGAPDLAFVLSGVISVARPRAVQGRVFSRHGPLCHVFAR